MKLVEKRKSIRKYRSEPIPEEHIKQMLEAARQAPSGGNRQPWHFTIVHDKETIKELAGKQQWAATAPVIIVGIINKNIPSGAYELNMGIAFEHLILAATDLDLGTCWMGLMGRKEEILKILELPSGFEAIVQTPVGYPAETQLNKDRRPLMDITSWI